MKYTHRLYRWTRDLGAHEYHKGISWRARFKKDGQIMFYKGTHLICMGSRPPYICYLNPEQLEKPVWASWKDSFGTKHKYQVYFTMEPM